MADYRALEGADVWGMQPCGYTAAGDRLWCQRAHPGGVSLRLRPSVDKSVERAAVSQHGSPPHSQPHDFVEAGGLGMPLESHLSLAVGSLVFLSSLFSLLCCLSAWPDVLGGCFLWCAVCHSFPISLTRFTTPTPALVVWLNG